jgi:DNA replication and repair protein RecF
MMLWKRFQKLLKQRNAALRGGAGLREIQAWHPELAETGEQLHRFRSEYLRELTAVFTSMSSVFPATQTGVVVSYQKGWREGVGYLESLNAAVAKDRDSGFTRSGPQRAELHFTLDEQPVGDRLSRGEQKVFITALQLAQAAHLHAETGKTSLFLLDDLGAELDVTNQRRVLELLVNISAQVFVTAIKEPISLNNDASSVRRFHVEHGILSEMV